MIKDYIDIPNIDLSKPFVYCSFKRIMEKKINMEDGLRKKIVENEI
jgi:hypothetical protein